MIVHMDTQLQILEAQRDEAALTALIRDHKRFILARAYHTAGRFITEEDDEYSVALIAFHEAVKTYDSEKGDFHAFASLVIKRRLIDHLKSEGRHAAETLVPPELMDGDVEDETAETALGLAIRRKEAELSEQNNASPGSNPVRDEIEAVQQILKGYGFSFFDLTECSPRAEKTKRACAKAVATLLANRELLKKLRESKALPMKELTEYSGVPRKILERHRRYIIAAAEILNGEYPLLAEYMSYIRKAMVT